MLQKSNKLEVDSKLVEIPLPEQAHTHRPTDNLKT